VAPSSVGAYASFKIIHLVKKTRLWIQSYDSRFYNYNARVIVGYRVFEI
jgi:hypothetical protein